MSNKKHKAKARPVVTEREYAARLARGGAAFLDVLQRVDARSDDPQMHQSVTLLQPAVLAEVLNASVAATTGT